MANEGSVAPPERINIRYKPSTADAPDRPKVFEALCRLDPGAAIRARMDGASTPTTSSPVNASSTNGASTNGSPTSSEGASSVNADDEDSTSSAPVESPTDEWENPYD